LLTALPAALNWVYGFQSTRLAEVQRRALELTQVLGREPHPPLLRSLAGSALSANDFGGARRFARQLRARGERDGEPGLLVEAEYLLGVAAFWIGQFADARAHLEAAIGHFHPEHRRAHLLTYAQDPEVICLNRLACVLWYLGYSDAAMQARERSLALAEEVGHPHTHSLALVFAALLAIEAHQPEQLRHFVATLATYSGGPDQWHAGTFGELLGGYVDVLDGKAASGLARIQRTIDDAPAIAPAPGQAAIRQRVLLGAREMAGDARAGLAAAERLLALGEAAGLWQAEAHRMRADFRATLGCSDEEVAAELEQALGIARNQGARSLELRAATSLLRHRVRHRSPALREAHDVLASVVHAFGERRDGHDLRVAANLLARC
jgi:tetratricopeptide (TPR) repeat protein